MVDFDYALKHISTPCEGNWDEFTDWELEEAPSPETANKMCEPCVLFDLCRNRARSEPPGWGVWGGEVWVDEKKYKEGTA